MPTSAPDSEPRVGVRFIGRYALLGKLAAGGMATVHVGRLMGPVGFTRSVAIKRLHPEYARDPAFVSMFLDEARLAAQISHPNVVSTLDVVATEGELFLVMEYVHGQSLSWLVRQASKTGELIPPRIVASIMSGCLMGLHAAHEARDERGVALNIVHRDVSPQNVLVGADGLARVLDFGVAKAVGRIQNTREGHIKGKLAYMPPEQIQTDTVSRQADIYAAAVVLWEALTATRLFKSETETATLAKILSGSVQAPSIHAPEVPPELDRVVMKGLAREPKDRYPTARAMATELERAVPVASITEVSDWLMSVSKRELDERAARIAAIEMSAGLKSTEGMDRLAEALATATPPEEDTSDSGRFASERRSSGGRPSPMRADTLPTSIQVGVRGTPGLAESGTMPAAPDVLAEQHGGESASQLSSVSLALGHTTAPPKLTRGRGMIALGMAAGGAIVAAALWLSVGPHREVKPPAAASPLPGPAPSAPAPATPTTPSAPVAPAEPPKGAAETSPEASAEPRATTSPDAGAAAPADAKRPPTGAPAAAPGPRKTPPRTRPRGGSPFDQLGGRD